MTESPPTSVAEQLHDWFGSILRLANEGLFGIAPDGPHRGAVVLDVLRRNARILSQSELDCDGRLYSPLCFFLAAACRRLGTSLGPAHWRAALENVAQLQHQARAARRQSAAVGLEMGSPAALLKQELDEAINQAGLATGVSYLDKENREVALGLAINWGIRLLLAYALECRSSASGSGQRDLAWVARLTEGILNTPNGSQR